MTEEKKLILKMLKEGKITEDEAIKLLDAVGKSDDKVGFSRQGNDFDEHKFEEKVENLTQSLMSSVDKAMKKVGESLSKIEVGYDFDFDLGNGFQYNVNNFKSSGEKTIEIELPDAEGLNISVYNNNGYTEISGYDGDKIKIEAQYKYDDRYVEPDYKFVDWVVEDNSVKIEGAKANSKKQPFVVNLEIELPNRLYQLILADSVNGSVELDGLEAKDIKVTSNNGRLEVAKCKADTIDLSSTNGKIFAENNSGETLLLNTVNGKVELELNSCKSIDATSVNGPVYCYGISLGNKLLNLDTVNSKVEIEIEDLDRPMSLQASAVTRLLSKMSLPRQFTEVNSKAGKLQATTFDYSEDSDIKLDINISVVNGKINIK